MGQRKKGAQRPQSSGKQLPADSRDDGSQSTNGATGRTLSNGREGASSSPASKPEEDKLASGGGRGGAVAGKGSNWKGGSTGKLLTGGQRVVPVKPELCETDQEEAIVRGDCENALRALRRGNPKKAIKILEDATKVRPNAAVGHRILSYIHKQISASLDDKVKEKKVHLKLAVDAAAKATQLKPQSLEFAMWHGVVLWEFASDDPGYEAVTAECRRALEVKGPSDPGLELFVEKDHQWPNDLRTVEQRVEHYRDQLRGLQRKVDLRGITTLLRSVHAPGTAGMLGDGSERGDLVPFMRKMTDDSLEQRVLQPKRANELKKNALTQEQRRRQIEAQVEAARLLQQTRAAQQPGQQQQHDQPAELEGLEGALLPDEEGGDQRGRKGKSSVVKKSLQLYKVVEEKVRRVRPFWADASRESRQELLQVPISDLFTRLKGLKTMECHQILTEALEYNKESGGSWRFWICYECGKRYQSDKAYKDHVQEPQSHLRVPREFAALKEFPAVEEEKLKPLDGPTVVATIWEEAVTGEVLHSTHPAVCDDGLTEGLSSRGMTKQVEIATNPGSGSNECSKWGEHKTLEEASHNGIGHCCPTHGLHCPPPVTLSEEALTKYIVEDEERQTILRELWALLQDHVDHRMLLADQVSLIFNFVSDSLHKMLPESQRTVLPRWSTDWNLLRLLTAEQLAEIIKYLQDAYQPPVEEVPADALITATVETEVAQVQVQEVQQPQQNPPIVDEINATELSEDGIKLRVGGAWLDVLAHKEEQEKEEGKGDRKDEGKEVAVGKKETLIGQVVEGTTLLAVADAMNGNSSLSSDKQLAWIYDLEELELQAAGRKVQLTWVGVKKDGRKRGGEFAEEIVEIGKKLHDLIKKNEELERLRTAVENAEEYAYRELRRAQRKGAGYPRLDAILQKRLRDVEDEKRRLVEVEKNLELRKVRHTELESLREAIVIVLRRMDQRLRHRRHPAIDSDDDDDEGGLAGAELGQNQRVEAAFDYCKRQIKQQLQQINEEESQTARNMTINFIRLADATVFDYRAALLPMIKQFIQSKLETAEEEDAVRKSNAAQEAFLADLAKEEACKVPEPARQAKAAKKKKGPKRESKKLNLQEMEDEEEEADEVDRQKAEEAAYRQKLLEDEHKLVEAMERMRLAEEQLKLDKQRSAEVQRPTSSDDELAQFALQITDDEDLLSQDPDKMAALVKQQQGIERQIEEEAQRRQQQQGTQVQQEQALPHGGAETSDDRGEQQRAPELVEERPPPTEPAPQLQLPLQGPSQLLGRPHEGMVVNEEVGTSAGGEAGRRGGLSSGDEWRQAGAGRGGVQGEHERKRGRAEERRLGHGQDGRWVLDVGEDRRRAGIEHGRGGEQRSLPQKPLPPKMPVPVKIPKGSLTFKQQHNQHQQHPQPPPHLQQPLPQQLDQEQQQPLALQQEQQQRQQQQQQHIHPSIPVGQHGHAGGPKPPSVGPRGGVERDEVAFGSPRASGGRPRRGHSDSRGIGQYQRGGGASQGQPQMHPQTPPHTGRPMALQQQCASSPPQSLLPLPPQPVPLSPLQALAASHHPAPISIPVPVSTGVDQYVVPQQAWGGEYLEYGPGLVPQGPPGQPQTPPHIQHQTQLQQQQHHQVLQSQHAQHAQQQLHVAHQQLQQHVQQQQQQVQQQAQQVQQQAQQLQQQSHAQQGRSAHMQRPLQHHTARQMLQEQPEPQQQVQHHHYEAQHLQPQQQQQPTQAAYLAVPGRVAGQEEDVDVSHLMQVLLPNPQQASVMGTSPLQQPSMLNASPMQQQPSVVGASPMQQQPSVVGAPPLPHDHLGAVPRTPSPHHTGPVPVPVASPAATRSAPKLFSAALREGRAAQMGPVPMAVHPQQQQQHGVGWGGERWKDEDKEWQQARQPEAEEQRQLGRGLGGVVDRRSHEQNGVAVDQEDVRFRADLEQAMRQSLEPPRPGGARSPPVGVAIAAPKENGVRSEDRPGTAAGRGLVNEVGQYNCFLNVVIQSLWHLRSFRERLQEPSAGRHHHVGKPCVVCALRDIFLALSSRAPDGASGEHAVAPTPLRVALDAMFAGSELFRESQMNDASEVLDVLFDCMHKAFSDGGGKLHVQANGGLAPEEDGKPGAGTGWECHVQHFGKGAVSKTGGCIVHELFGLDVAEQMKCGECGVMSRKLRYTTFFHNINASALRMAKASHADLTLAELLQLVDHSHQLPCDADVGGCNKLNTMQHLLRTAPLVFTTVLGWQNGQESADDISATVDTIEGSLEVGKIYQGLKPGSQHRLVSVVCYYGQHYHCFAYNTELASWVMFDDTTIKLVGAWEEVTRACRRGHLQPQVLFYELVS